MPELYEDGVVSLLPFGTIQFTTTEVGVRNIRWIEAQPETEPATALQRQLVAGLLQYLQDPGYAFDLPLQIIGTEFQQRVWHALRQIPSGRSMTYGQLAQNLGTSARAIGGACRANPLPIIVPCHRVVGKDGIGGYAGHRCGERHQIKRKLLYHEGYIDRLETTPCYELNV